MQVYFLRHAEAARGTGADADRPLTDRGRSQARSLGNLLHRHDIRFDVVLCSPLARAQETARAVCAELRMDEPRISPNLGPGGSESALMDEVETLRAQSILLVGHQPDMSDIVGNLIDSKGSASVAFDPCTLARVDTTGPLRRGCGVLMFLLPHGFSETSSTRD